MVANNDANRSRTYTKYIGNIASISHRVDARTAGLGPTIEDREGFHKGLQLASVFPALSLTQWDQFFTGTGLLLKHNPTLTAATFSNVLWFIVAFAIVGYLIRMGFGQAAAGSVVGRLRWQVARVLVMLGWLSPRRARQWRGPAPGCTRRALSGRHQSLRLLSTGIVCLCFLGAYVPPVFAALTPGSEGAGVPVSGTMLYYTGDHLGSTALVTDAQGNEVSRVNYTPFGEIDQTHSHGTDNYRAKFTGKEFDYATGLYYMGSRYYDAHTGRFFTPDPAAQYHSPYAYSNGDPLSGTDPDGEFFITLAIMVIGVLAGGYMGGAAVNHSANPGSWNFKSGKTWTGIIGGMAIGAVTGGAGIALDGAGLGVGATMAGGALLGGADNAAFAAMGGDSWAGVGEAFAVGALLGGALSGLGRGFRAVASGKAVRETTEVVEELCNSFVAGVEIATENGAKNIEDIKVGDKVWSYNEETAAVELNSVVQLMNHIEDEEYLVVVVEGEEIEVTTEHPFYVEGKGWVNAGALDVGDKLHKKDGSLIKVQRLTKKSDDALVYNIEVENNHNYFVSGNEVLVHNCPLTEEEVAAKTDELNRKVLAKYRQVDASIKLKDAWRQRNVSIEGTYEKEVVNNVGAEWEKQEFNQGFRLSATDEAKERIAKEYLTGREPTYKRGEYRKPDFKESSKRWVANFGTGRVDPGVVGLGVKVKPRYEINIHVNIK